MKALQITQYGVISESLAIKTIAKPSLQNKDVLIAVKAASLNPIDYKIVGGYLKEMIALDLPATIAYDVSGVIVEKGSEVDSFEIGDEVYARVPQEQMGTVAEFVAVNSEVIALKPINLSFEEASALPLAGLTAIQALERVGIKKDDRVLIHAGSGGVGSFAIQYAKHKGAIVYTTTSTKNVDWVKALGADRVIDYTKENYQEVANNLDIVFDTLGGDYTLGAFEIIKEGGKVSSIAGSAPDEETAQMMGMKDYQLPEHLAALIQKKSAVYKLTWMQPNGEQLQLIKSLIEAGTIKPIIDLIYPFEKGVEAYEHLATGHAQGKVIISFSAHS